MARSYSFQPYGVGKKVYGGGRSSPHVGGGLDKLGYKERDAKHRIKRNAVLRRMQAGQKKQYMSSAWLGGPK